MVPSNDLFDLIKSLTRSEKRYFRLFSERNRRGGENKYGRLFELIDRQSEYDEEEIRAALAGDPMERNLPAAKNYLHNAILRALHFYHMEHSHDAQASLLIHQAEILNRKKLYGQCAKVLARAKELAARHELWHLMLDIIWLEYSLMMVGESVGDLEERVGALMEELRRTLEVLGNRYDFEMIQARLYANMVVQGDPRTAEQKRSMRAILGDSFEADDAIAISPMAKLYHHTTHGIFWQSTGEHALALEAYRRTLAIIDEHEALRSGNFLNPVLNNICVSATVVGDEDNFFTHHRRLIESTTSDPGAEGFKSHIAALDLLAKWHASTGDFERSLAANRDVEEAVSRFNGKLRVGFAEQMTFAGFAINFGVGDYPRALDYLNAILDRPGNDISPFAFTRAKLYILVAHLELGNYQLLEYLLPSTTRALRSRDMIFRTEELLLRFFRRTLRAATDADRRALAAELSEEIAPLADDPQERPLLDGIDIPAWIESRATGRSYACVVRERYLEKARLRARSTQPSLC